VTVVFDRPYQFVPPHRGNWWPSFIQTFRIVDRYLRLKEGVVDCECRDLDRFEQSIDRGDGILLAPNHCRYADPLVLGWPARQLQIHLYAMASWHLFNKSRFDEFALQKMGAFSIHREGTDRQSLETAIEILATAERPLVLFPEGTTNRTNDVLKPLLDGISFIARSAARRRAKAGQGRVVMHPVAIKYLCQTDFVPWADQQLRRIEKQFGWERSADGASSAKVILQRTLRLLEAMLALKEIEYLGRSQCGDLACRRDKLISFLLQQAEQRLELDPRQEDIQSRVRAVRSEVSARYFRDRKDLSSEKEDLLEHERLRQDVAAADLAQELSSYPDCYLDGDEVTDTRLVETIQRMQEKLWGKADVSIPLRVVIQFAEPIEVSPQKPPRGQADPMMNQLRGQLTEMLAALSKEARPVPFESRSG